MCNYITKQFYDLVMNLSEFPEADPTIFVSSIVTVTVRLQEYLVIAHLEMKMLDIQRGMTAPIPSKYCLQQQCCSWCRSADGWVLDLLTIPLVYQPRLSQHSNRHSIGVLPACSLKNLYAWQTLTVMTSFEQHPLSHRHINLYVENFLQYKISEEH